MNNEISKRNLKWILGIMIVMGVSLFYLNLTGKRILGSNVEKWNPEGNKRSHK
jgi:hypothetical protein